MNFNLRPVALAILMLRSIIGGLIPTSAGVPLARGSP
jgi:hypothetical protein